MIKETYINHPRIMNISFTPKYTNNKRRDCFTGNSSLEIKLERSNSLRKSGSRSFLFPVFTLVPRNVFQFAFFLETEAIRVRIGTFQNTFPVVFSTTAKFVYFLRGLFLYHCPVSNYNIPPLAGTRDQFFLFGSCVWPQCEFVTRNGISVVFHSDFLI